MTTIICNQNNNFLIIIVMEIKILKSYNLDFDIRFTNYILYILINRKRTKTYVGITVDLARRIREHNSENNKTNSTKGNKWDIAFVIHGFSSETDVRSFEWRMHKMNSMKKKRKKLKKYNNQNENDNEKNKYKTKRKKTPRSLKAPINIHKSLQHRIMCAKILMNGYKNYQYVQYNENRFGNLSVSICTTSIDFFDILLLLWQACQPLDCI